MDIRVLTVDVFVRGHVARLRYANDYRFVVGFITARCQVLVGCR